MESLLASCANISSLPSKASGWDAGSHTVLCLLEHGYYVVIIDNLDNAFEEAYRCASSTME